MIGMETKISVIIPTYLPKDYLWECMDCLENQTLSKDEFEVILVLNGEREPYESNIRKKLHEYTFTNKLLYSTPNGVSKARNMGLDHAQGQYICFIDDDDWVSDNYLEELLSRANANSIVAANVVEVDEETKQVNGKHFLSRAYKNYQPAKEASCYANRSFFSSACCKILPMACIKGQRFDTHIKRGEDSIFMYGISRNIKQVRITPPACIYYVRKRHQSAGRHKTNFIINLYEFLSQSTKYTTMYFQHLTHRNPLFYLSRIAGTFYNKLIQKK